MENFKQILLELDQMTIEELQNYEKRIENILKKMEEGGVKNV